MSASTTTVAVVIATYRRPTYVRTCLDHLAAQSRQPDEIFVVDASPDDLTREVVAQRPGVRYLRNERGAGTTATSRRIGLAAASSDVLAFLDDDSFAEPDWLAELLGPYADPRVGAVGGRARRGQPGEETISAEEIGRLLPDGHLSGNFAADPGHSVDVDHLLGANMSVRRDVIEQLGGIRDYYPGTCLREESDIVLRIRNAGHRVVYTPRAVVDHVAAPHWRGRRFDLRYEYYGQRNHIVLLARTFGLHSPLLTQYLGRTLPRDCLRGVSRAAGAVGSEMKGRPAAHPAVVRKAVNSFGRAALSIAVNLGGAAAGYRSALALERTEGSVAVPVVVSPSV